MDLHSELQEDFIDDRFVGLSNPILSVDELYNILESVGVCMQPRQKADAFY